MDIGEKLAQLLFRGAGRVRRRLQAPSPAAAELAPLRGRLEILATLLAGRPVQVHPADGEGGISGDHLLLPRCVDVFSDPEPNRDVYLFRVAYDTTTAKLGFELPDAALAPWYGELASLLALPAIYDAMAHTYPAASELRRRLSHGFLDARPPISQPRSLRDALELLCRLGLGASLEDLQGDAEPAVASWLQRAAGARPATPQALHDETRHLLQAAHELPRPRGERLRPVLLWGRLQPPPPGGDAIPQEDEKPSQDLGTQRTLELERSIRARRQERSEREDKPLYHVFEKLETLEDYGGESSTPDPEGDLRQTEEALRELDLGKVIRSMERPQNLVRADIMTEPTSWVSEGTSDATGAVYRYPEWSYKKGRYRPDWCTVIERRAAPSGPEARGHRQQARERIAARRRHVDALRSHLLRALFRRQVRNRQTEGPDIDVEAMVERHADLQAGHTPPERLYLSAKRTPKDVAIFVLLDTSYSTDAWIGGRRVLDIEVDAVLMLSEAFRGYFEEEIAVAAFHSRSRHACYLDLLKDFPQPWHELQASMPALQPEGYTRIGPAVRHATALLERRHARRKLLLLISDGKPTDYDQYEGRYGTEDVAKALREADQRGVLTFGLAVEKQAKLHLARMLGKGRYRILPRPDLLPEAMADLFVELVTR